MSSASPTSTSARARDQLKTAGWPAEPYAARLARRRAQARHDVRHRRRRGADRPSGHRGDRRGDRRAAAPASRTRCEAIAQRQAHRDGQRRGRRARRARCWRARRKAAGVVYSLAWGDQPALICEHVDWARACGFKVICGRQGHALRAALPPVDARHRLGHPRQVPEDHGSQLDQSEDVQLVRRRHQVRHRDDRGVQRDRPACRRPTALRFPPATRFELAEICKPKSDGGTLEKEGVTEVDVLGLPRRPRRAASISRWAPTWCSRARPNTRGAASSEYAMLPDKSGRYAALYRPIHMIGLELGISVASAALRREPTGVADRLPLRRRRDRQARPQGRRDARRRGRLLRLGQADPGRRARSTTGCCRSASRTTSSSSATSRKARRSKWADVDYDPTDIAVNFRREMEAAFGRPNV